MIPRKRGEHDADGDAAANVEPRLGAEHDRVERERQK